MTTFDPCPWCGGKAALVKRDVEPQGDPWYGGRVESFVLCECGACLFDGYFHEGFSSPERAIAAWNTRALPPSPGQEQAADPLADLVARFSEALLSKLRAAQRKYGYDGWVRDDWADELRLHLRQHVEKGDPRDVAAYCAFAWHHGWSLAQPAPSPATPELRKVNQFSSAVTDDPVPFVICTQCRGWGLYGGEPCDTCDGERVLRCATPAQEV